MTGNKNVDIPMASDSTEPTAFLQSKTFNKT